ncbi:hypothetical protein DIURU_000369 [Diutina rugosa]|uniref:Mitochondrial inner membrane protease subunit n=1 Tax=Diutina rugosa TaxID=5481 RepID=A0A642UYY1_DIURU|nr:uncharacterized protein DIURU_000369 [Diutina rugosa]KAA8907959.1 hypothetical protein DIURU_000369 [Diutina rugosa]
MSSSLRKAVIGLTWLPVAYTVLNHGVSPCRITGRSMSPTFNPGTSTTAEDVVLVTKFGAKTASNIHRGDVIMFRSPRDPEKILTKRVVAVAGDTVYPKQPYPKQKAGVPRNHVWVEGDNYFHSIDSNTFGPISLGLVTGKVVAVVWPPSRWGADLSTGGRNPMDPLTV